MIAPPAGANKGRETHDRRADAETQWLKLAGAALLLVAFAAGTAGRAASPGVQMGAGGTTVTHTSCVTNANPITPDGHTPKAGAHDDQCKVTKIDRTGSSISWIIDCQTPQNTSHTEGTAHYAGDTMEATFKTRVKQGGTTNEISQHLTGHYLGPCEK